MGGKDNFVERMETGQNMFEHEADEDQKDIDTTEVKKVTNDIDTDFNVFDRMKWAEYEPVANMTVLDTDTGSTVVPVVNDFSEQDVKIV